MNQTHILLANNFAPLLPVATGTPANDEGVGTVLSNLAYYGFVPSVELLRGLRTLSDDNLSSFWLAAEPVIKKVTGADRNMSKFVVYKNFPKEVLKKTEAEYWIAQILMYWGLPNEYFAEPEKARKPLKEQPSLTVLAFSTESTLALIWDRLVASKARWNDNQIEQATALLDIFKPVVVVDSFGFKENAIQMARLTTGEIEIGNATDVLRLAAAMSGGDVALREKVRFASFKRADRRKLLDLLVATKNLEDDVALRPDVWKRLLHALRPGDWKSYARVSTVYDGLYRGALTTHASTVEVGLLARDPATLSAMKQRPGDFLRRLHKAYAVFGKPAIDAFVEVLPKLSTSQLVKIDRYLATINSRKTLMVAPRGNWARAKVLENAKVPFGSEDLCTLRASISQTISDRLTAAHPEGFDVDPMVESVKLQTNDQKLAPYGRGTVFPIPENMTFVRSASYWAAPGYGNIWYDVGWNFYTDGWHPVGTCCWNHTHEVEGAVFSGDPTNSKDLKGRACQMIDLNIDKLKESGIRYAVWNVLCFSNQSFEAADEVLATLQWGEHAQKGNLYEPARAQMVFPLKGAAMTKYVAYLDLQERTLVYVDADLRGDVSSAGSNLRHLGEVFPAYVEYLNSLPSIGDIFIHAPKGSTPVLYSDEDRKIVGGNAYVFQPRNAANEFTPVEINALLGA